MKLKINGLSALSINHPEINVQWNTSHYYRDIKNYTDRQTTAYKCVSARVRLQ